MMKCNPSIKILLFFAVLFAQSASSQTIQQQLTTAIKKFQSDPQMRHAITGICVYDTKTGKKIFGHNDQVGLAPASTQKIFTSAAAFELLGSNFHYKTELGIKGKTNGNALQPSLVIVGSGDPTFGSWRWKETRDTVILKKFGDAIIAAGISSIGGGILSNESKFSHQAIPDGWIWQDIGNYYGAGAYAINWKENQYDLFLRSGNNVGDPVAILESEGVHADDFVNELRSAPKNSGDNAYLYFQAAEHRSPLIRGSIPVNEKQFSISGASPDPVSEFITDLSSYVAKFPIPVAPYEGHRRDHVSRNENELASLKIVSFHFSPTLDSMNYYFMRRSINLYGEAFVKTIALEKEGLGDTEKGIGIIRDFWSALGIEKSAIHIIDGSGLSPQNRVTTEAQVKVLQYARTRSWFQSFYHSLPEFNGMKMKSGSIGGARAFAGYHKAKNGREYTFSIIVNNYDGSAGEVVKKMYRVLDLLK
jgi:D-alanyl-D-alanine carboxypeptidase/D-alanyl-D-alanine-endopeptidase (penicillin-binding protein 4)